MTKYKNELFHKMANASAETASMESLKQMHYDDQLGYFSGLSDKDLEEAATDLDVDYELFIKEARENK